MQYTHYLTWLTLGDTAAAITTQISDGRDAHDAHVSEACAGYPDDEDGNRPDLLVGETYVAIAYKDLPDELTDVALDGTSADLEHIGHEQFGETWYGRAA